MKFMIVSDIHGSYTDLKRVMEIYEEEKMDKLVLLGDLLYHGPRNPLPEGYQPQEVMKLLNTYKENIIAVRGNCDAEVDQMVLEFPVLADYCLLPVGEHLVYATHGHVYNESNLPPLMPGDILLHGHTHIPCCNRHETYTYLNPGSVSIPKEQSPHGYMILEGTKFTWKTMEGKAWQEFNV